MSNYNINIVLSILYFLLFTFGTRAVLMQVFKYSTFWKYFPYLILPLACLGVFTGWLFNFALLSASWWLYSLIIFARLIVNFQGDLQRRRDLGHLLKHKGYLAAKYYFGTIWDQGHDFDPIEVKKSLNRTILFYWLSSFLYLGGFICSVLYFKMERS
jgi:hypothetical protein